MSVTRHTVMMPWIAKRDRARRALKRDTHPIIGVPQCEILSSVQQPQLGLVAYGVGV